MATVQMSGGLFVDDHDFIHVDKQEVVKKSSIGGKQYLDYLWEPSWLLCYI